jgi:hypothetical protein
MSVNVPTCQTIKVFAFRGDRSRSFATAFQGKLDDEKRSLGPGPTVQDCLLYAGHAGVSVDQHGRIIYGFNPDAIGVPVWQMLEILKNGDRFHGVVCDDTAVFTAAKTRGLPVLSFEVILPDPAFRNFQSKLDGELWKSQYYYGFPNGDGDCNCTTWLERLGLPLLTGRMDEIVGLPGISSYPSRRFGRCR